jgi:HlyD family secretion protein
MRKGIALRACAGLALAVALAGPAQGAGPKPPGPLEASGVIEARQVVIAAEFAGRVSAVHVAEGEAVAEGALLVELDDAPLQASLQQAEAAVRAAEAEAAVTRAAARPEEVAMAQAQVAQAEAALAGARRRWEDAVDARRDPRELEARLVEARTRAATAAQALEAAEADLARAAFERDRLKWNSTQWHAADLRRQAYEHGVAAAGADLRAAQAYLQGLEAIRARPLALLAAEHSAEGAMHVAEAALAVAEARLADLEAGPLPEDVALAEARVELARAQAAYVRHQIERLALRSPTGGTVLARLVQPGETVQPGAPLLHIGDLRRVELVLYIPEPTIGELSLGQAVAVHVDSYPERTFAGHVTRIADQAEFTPRNVATREERINTYYAVRVSLANPDGALKAGMPADAVLAP